MHGNNQVDYIINMLTKESKHWYKNMLIISLQSPKHVNHPSKRACYYLCEEGGRTNKISTRLRNLRKN